ncbi:hypothetical protein HK105_203739 [Polyrhizophydium stewartii]|uniref:non-specific serine/threonine protein kinase n=1 Tax=Polyrhizophydium stewartii TaxID=2732419 RepID=A0ABR4NAR1_9FUNG
MHAGAPQAVVELEKLLGILESLAQSLVRMSPLLQVLHSLSVAERLTAIDGQISDIALRYSLAIPVVGEIAIAIQSDIRQLSSLVGQIATNDIQAMQAPAMRIDTLFAISQYKSQILGVLAEPIREPFGLLLAATNDLIFSTTSRRLVEVRGISISPDGVDILWNEALAGRSLYGDCYKGFLRGESVDVQLIDGIDSHDLATALGRCVARLAKIDHPNLLKPLRVCLNSDRPFVITHPARRTALELLRDQPQLSLPQRISIIAQTAVALRQLHDFRLPAIHGGLCAECILLDDDGNVKLAYAGFAMLKLARVCYGQRRISTMRWIAPELFLRGNAPNVSTDIFAFGMTALHILAGVEPFSELAEQDAVIMSWVRDGLRPSRPQGIPDGIWYMIEGCLSAVPSMRPSLERIVACLEDKDNLVVRDTDAAFMPPIKMDPSSSLPAIESALINAVQSRARANDLSDILGSSFESSESSLASRLLAEHASTDFDFVQPELQDYRAMAFGSRQSLQSGTLEPLAGQGSASEQRLPSVENPSEQPSAPSKQDAGATSSNLSNSPQQTPPSPSLERQAAQVRTVVAMFSRWANDANVSPTHYSASIGKHFVFNGGDLVELNLSRQSLSGFLSTSVSSLVSLEKLILSKNSLRGNLTGSIGLLSRLRVLDISCNEITSLPETLRNLSKLEELIVDHNRLRSLPAGIGNLQALTFLDAGCNELDTLPGSIGQLSFLKTLLLDRNRLIALPRKLSCSILLRKLNVADNPIKEIPSTFTMLKRLEYLNVSNTNVSYISSKIRKLPGINLLFKNTPFQRRFESSDFEDSDDGDDDDDDHNRR